MVIKNVSLETVIGGEINSQLYDKLERCEEIKAKRNKAKNDNTL